MAFDWRRYVEVALYLQGGASGHVDAEAALRSAVSRAYYGAYCLARNHARDNQNFMPTGTHRDHALVRTHFIGQGDYQLAGWLDQLRQWRNDCDYDDAVPNLAQMVGTALAMAQGVVARFP